MVKRGLIVLLAFLHLLNCVSVTILPSYNVGGIFDTYYNNSDGSLTNVEEGYFHMLAFLMAINDVNNKTDGIADSLLTSTSLNPVIEFDENWNSTLPRNECLEGYTVAYDLFESANENVLGVVSTTGNRNTDASLSFFSGSLVSEFVTVTSSSDFTHGHRYPTMLRLIPSDSSQATSLTKWLFWTDVVVIYSSDTFGADCNTRFGLAAPGAGIKILGSYSVTPSATDFTDLITIVKDVGARIFILFMDATRTGLLMEQGHNAGLFVQNTQIIGSTMAASSDVWKAMSSSADKASIMRGYITIFPAPHLYLQTSNGASFAKRLEAFQQKAPPSTASTSAVSAIGYYCESNSASGASSQLCQLYDGFANTLNSTLALAKYPELLYTYDAVITLSNTLQGMIEKSVTITSDALHTILLNSTRKHSSEEAPTLTGKNNFFAGVRASNYFGRGDRRNAGLYVIQNFDAEVFAASFGNAGLVNVGYYSDFTGLHLCSDVASSSDFQLPDCATSIVYNTAGDGSAIPTDKNEDIIVKASPSYKHAAVAIAAIVAFIHLLCGAFLMRNWKEKEIRHSQPKILVVMVLAGFVVAVYLLTLTADVTLSLWRMDKLINATATWELTITDDKLFAYFMFILGVVLFLSITAVAAGKMKIVYDIEVEHNQRTLTPKCSSPYGTAGATCHTFMVLYLIGLLMSAAWFLWVTRGVPAFFNEIRVIAPAFAASLALVAAVITIQALVALSYDVKFIVSVGLWTLIVLLISCSYYGRKVAIIRSRVRRIETFRSIAGFASVNDGDCCTDDVARSTTDAAAAVGGEAGSLSRDNGGSFRLVDIESNRLVLTPRIKEGTKLTASSSSGGGATTAGLTTNSSVGGGQSVVTCTTPPKPNAWSQNERLAPIASQQGSREPTPSNAVANNNNRFSDTPTNPNPNLSIPVPSRRNSNAAGAASSGRQMNSAQNTFRRSPAQFQLELTETCESYADSIGFINALMNRDITSLKKMKLCSEQVFLWKALMKKLEIVYESTGSAGESVELRFERDGPLASGQYALVEGPRTLRNGAAQGSNSNSGSRSQDEVSALSRSSNERIAGMNHLTNSSNNETSASIRGRDSAGEISIRRGNNNNTNNTISSVAGSSAASNGNGSDSDNPNATSNTGKNNTGKGYSMSLFRSSKKKLASNETNSSNSNKNTTNSNNDQTTYRNSNSTSITVTNAKNANSLLNNVPSNTNANTGGNTESGNSNNNNSNGYESVNTGGNLETIQDNVDTVRVDFRKNSSRSVGSSSNRNNNTNNANNNINIYNDENISNSINAYQTVMGGQKRISPPSRRYSKKLKEEDEEDDLY